VGADAAEPHAPVSDPSATETLALPSSPEDLARGGRLFALHCASCHGRDGEGNKGPTVAVPRLSRAADADALVRIIRNGINGTQMPKSSLLLDEARAIAAWVVALGQRPAETVPGDPARGEALYMGKGACTKCHMLKGRGGAFGPDLSDVGRRRGAAHLRTSLVDPSADVPRSFNVYRGDAPILQNFLLVRVRTKAGRVLTGVRVNEDTFSVQVRDLSGRIHSFFKSELAELDKQWGVSPMPAYGEMFSKDELDDLVAFLASLREP
jgi:cytochrome c oxidase cbb3-type subunit 3